MGLTWGWASHHSLCNGKGRDKVGGQGGGAANLRCGRRRVWRASGGRRRGRGAAPEDADAREAPEMGHALEVVADDEREGGEEEEAARELEHDEEEGMAARESACELERVEREVGQVPSRGQRAGER